MIMFDSRQHGSFQSKHKWEWSLPVWVWVAYLNVQDTVMWAESLSPRWAVGCCWGPKSQEFSLSIGCSYSSWPTGGSPLYPQHSHRNKVKCHALKRTFSIRFNWNLWRIMLYLQSYEGADHWGMYQWGWQGELLKSGAGCWGWWPSLQRRWVGAEWLQLLVAEEKTLLIQNLKWNNKTICQCSSWSLTAKVLLRWSFF